MNERMTIAGAMQAAADSGDRYGILLQQDGIEVGFYAPRGTDPQTPHDRDEVYIIQAGSGVFMLGEDEQPFETGDVLFVPAGMPHHFKDFGDNFGAWVVFTGKTA